MKERIRAVSASELGQYEFCSMSHYLSKEGARISGEGNSRLAEGKEDHRIHAKVITRRRSLNRFFTYLIIIILVALLLVYYFQF